MCGTAVLTGYFVSVSAQRESEMKCDVFESRAAAREVCALTMCYYVREVKGLERAICFLFCFIFGSVFPNPLIPLLDYECRKIHNSWCLVKITRHYPVVLPQMHDRMNQ